MCERETERDRDRKREREEEGEPKSKRERKSDRSTGHIIIKCSECIDMRSNGCSTKSETNLQEKK